MENVFFDFYSNNFNSGCYGCVCCFMLLRYVFYFGKVICVMIFLNIDVSFCFIVVFGIFFVVFLVIIIFVCYVCVL